MALACSFLCSFLPAIVRVLLDNGIPNEQLLELGDFQALKSASVFVWERREWKQTEPD